jgi:hypothetical protein
VLISQDFNVPRFLNKDTISLLESFIPQENNTLLDVFDDSFSALVGA